MWWRYFSRWYSSKHDNAWYIILAKVYIKILKKKVLKKNWKNTKDKIFKDTKDEATKEEKKNTKDKTQKIYFNKQKPRRGNTKD